MSSTYSYTVSPASLHSRPDGREGQPHYTDTSYTHHDQPTTVNPKQLLSPYSSHIQSNSASPSNNSNTPAESTSTLSVFPSDFGSDFGDPFFGVNFNDPDGGTPSFLDEQTSFNSDLPPDWQSAPTREPVLGYSDPPSPQDTTTATRSNISAPHLTPDSNTESFSSAQSPIPAAAAMASPRVTVSVWDRNGGQPVSTLPRSFASGNGSLRNPRLGNDDALSVETLHGSVPSVTRDTKGGWMPNMATGQGGLPPDNRPSDETMSANELATARKVDKSNEQVASWLSDTADQTKEHHPDGSMNKNDSRSAAEDDNIPSTEIPLGHTTVNRHIPNQVYYTTNFQDDDKGGPSSGGFNQTDFDLLPKRNWADAPMIHSIDLKKTQPESSQDAIAKFERSCQDNASFVSRAATWGTRRRSLPSVYDTEGVISGGFFKMLSLKGESSLRRPSLLKKIPSLVRRPSSSQILKRKGSNGEEVTEESTSSNRRESRDSLAPPPRSPSWGMKQKLTPSLNTAILGMSTGAASIGASHARTGSISASSMASPKSPFGLAPVKNHLRRARSKTEIPKTELSHPNIVGMMKKAGGPPAVQLPKSHTMLDQDEDEDDEEEPFDDLDMKMEAGQTVDIAPTTDGFHQHILRLNPDLAHTNQYLVDRIAHQMVVRFKNLQNQKIKHLKAARLGYCKSGSFCLETGGQAVPLDPKGDARGFEPLSSRSQSPDGDVTPFEGGLNADTFPAGIPMPPTTVLPAEFECHICFTTRRFIKPSDWTKHVHEDAQPFTCTWDRCREPKMFKRKADWVRHENEGHRHLEWWTCDVEDCKHTCYRRDNFLQHLVREHKFTEPKIKTKAAIKKSGAADPTWQKVEKCHIETSARPQEEPCKFCGKNFPSWKKLTVHLAKHMEHISLPVLRLVSAKDLNEDTIISPVQDLPPRNFLPTPVKTEAPAFSPQRPHAFSNPVDYSPNNAFGLPQFYSQHPASSHFGGMPQNPSSGLMPQVTTGYSQQQYQTMPVTNGASYGNSFVASQSHLEPFPELNNPLGLQDLSGGQFYDAIPNPSMSNVDRYGTNHGSVSPYSRSPHPGNGGFYTQQ